jgi:hypothetical protein
MPRGRFRVLGQRRRLKNRRPNDEIGVLENSAVPTGLKLLMRLFPALKRRAIVSCPSVSDGTNRSGRITVGKRASDSESIPRHDR